MQKKKIKRIPTRYARFDHFCNLHEGMTGVIVGKGPSFDTWKEKRFTRPENSIIIGINHVYKFAPVDYAIGADEGSFADNPPRMGFRWRGKLGLEDSPGFWWVNKFGRRKHKDGDVKKFSRSDIANNRQLFSISSTSQMAIHLAWYMGCTDIALIGLDGHGGYAGTFDEYEGTTMSPPSIYQLIRRDNESMLNTLYPNAWKDLYPNY